MLRLRILRTFAETEMGNRGKKIHNATTALVWDMHGIWSYFGVGFYLFIIMTSYFYLPLAVSYR